MRWAGLLLVLFGLLHPVHGQGRDPSSSPVTSVDGPFDSDADEPQLTLRLGETDQLRAIEYLQSHPYNLNTVSLEELQAIPDASPEDAIAVIDYRKRIKQFLSVTQLLSIPGSGERIYHDLLPFVIVTHGVHKPFRTELRTRISINEGDASLPGLAAFYERLLAGISDMASAGVLIEKPQGSGFANSFLSGYLVLNGGGWLSQIVIGDFVMEGGQGLVFWKNRYSSKEQVSRAASRRTAGEIRPSVSSSDASFRGIAISFAHPWFEPVTASIVASKRDLRAMRGTLDESETQLLTELQTSSAALSPGDQLIERLMGGRLDWSPCEGVVAGMSYYRAKFERTAFEPTVQEQWRSGAEVSGVDVRASTGEAHFFGEIARSGVGARALLLGLEIMHPGTGNISATWRDYSPHFFNPHAGGFGENSLTRNETGYCISWGLEAGRKSELTGYFDQYRYPAGTGEDLLPRGGCECVIQLHRQVNDRVTLGLRISREIREQSLTSSNGDDGLISSTEERKSFCESVAAGFDVSSCLHLTTRVSFHQTSSPSEDEGGSGEMITQEIAIRPGPAFQCSGRIVVVGAGIHTPPLYVTNADLPGTYSHTVFSGSGTRWLFIGQWRPSKWIRASLTWSVTEKQRRASGTSPGAVEVSRGRGVGLQIDCQW